MGFSEDSRKNKVSRRPPRPATTLILVRDHNHDLQTYLLKRSSRSRFFPGSYVFPGGVVDEDDRDFHFWKYHADMGMDEVERRFGGAGITVEDALSYCVAGIRETFEEAGVLMASRKAMMSHEAACRKRASEGLEIGWLRGLVSSEGWILDLISLSRWAHWITPELMKYHFDTRFFIAVMPQGQSCIPDRDETEEGMWMAPGEALLSNLKGAVPLSPPTIVTMQELLAYTDVRSLTAGWEGKAWEGPRMPRMIQSEIGTIIIEPWDPQYDNAGEVMDMTGIESLILPACEPFSRLLLHNGIWKPVRTV